MNKLKIHNHYGSVTEAIEATTLPFRVDENRFVLDVNYSARNPDDSERFYGVVGGFQAAERTIMGGNQKVLDSILTLRQSIPDESLPKAIGVGRRRVRGDYGDEHDIHAANRGAFDRAWSRSVRQVRRGTSVVDVWVDIGANSTVNATKQQWRGVAVAALGDVLERAGYSLNIIASQVVEGATKSKSREDLRMYSVRVKSERDSLSLPALASTVANPCFYRTLGFKLIVRLCDNTMRPTSSNLGYPSDLSPHVPHSTDRLTFIAEGIDSAESALEWVNKTIVLLNSGGAE
jgi:hypothetical protein